MKVFLITLAFLASSVLAKSVDIDWNNVRPITQYRKFWDNKPASLRPSESFFAQAEEESRSGRIVGGSIAAPNQFPYQVALIMFFPSLGGAALCGGSVLSDRLILTAAHCVDEATDGTVILGAHDRTNAAEPGQVRRTVDAALGHIRWIPSWDPSLLRDDIALIQMPIAVPLSDIIRPVRLPTVDELNIDFAGELAVVSGFGVWSDSVGQSSTVVRFVEENVITNTACNIRYLGIIQPSHVCLLGTNGRGACSGDSGGPLTVQRGAQSLQIGVVSFGLATGCEGNWPSVFARTTSFFTWLNQNNGW